LVKLLRRSAQSNQKGNMNNILRGVKRQTRIRKKIRLTSDRVRLTVFRSNKYLYAQIIDDKAGKTLIGISEKQLEKTTGTKSERAKLLGAKIAQLAKEKQISRVVFDKGQYSYHGRIKSLAEGAREGGLVF
jgi:large subunit ribosomal protein L18